MSRIVTVGSIAFDNVKTPAGFREKALGGSANFFSLSASFFAPVGVVGVVGNDYPKDAISLLEHATIDTSGIFVEDGETFHWVGEYDQDLNEAKTLSTRLNVFSNFNPVLPDHYRDAEYVFLANIDPVCQRNVLDQVRGKPFVGLDTMNFWITGKRDELLKTLKRVDLLTINEGEAYLLSESQNMVEAANTILNMGPHYLVVKRGEYGAVLFTREEIFTAPAYPLEVVRDPTGAGDSFAGGMMGYLARTGPHVTSTTLRKGMIYGSIMASYAVDQFSFDRLITLTPEEIQARYSQFEKMTYFHQEEGAVEPKRCPTARSAWACFS